MAYINIERNRAATLAVVGALHAGVIYALVVGLAGPVWKMIEKQPFVGQQIPLPKPPPEATRTAEPRTSSKPTQQDPANPLPLPQKPSTDPGQKMDPVASTGTGEDFPLPLPRTLPSPPPERFPPTLSRPIGQPGLWVTANDYPSADLRAEHEGTTRFQLSIGADGRVQSCKITVSSGFATLDAAACANIRKRGRFAAATDAMGARVASTYSSAVRWTIPKT
jgi:protein TonB